MMDRSQNLAGMWVFLSFVGGWHSPGCGTVFDGLPAELNRLERHGG